MTVRDVANYLNVDEKTVYRLAQKGELPGFKVAGTWRFKREDIYQWIEDQKMRAVDKREDGDAEKRKPTRTGQSRCSNKGGA